jgi:multidrug efflux system outer membrane protein
MIIPLIALCAALQDPPPLTLASAVDRAIATHPTVEAARARRDRAAADVAETRATRLPQVALDIGANRFEEPMVVYPLHGFDLRNPPLFDRTLVQTSVGGSWTVADFGRRAARLRSQAALLDAANAAAASAAEQLVIRTTRAYLAVQDGREQRGAQDQRLAALDAARRRVADLMREGRAARLDQLRVETAMARARAERVSVVAQLDAAEHELAQLMRTDAAVIRGASLAPVRAVAGTDPDTSAAGIAALLARATAAASDVHAADERARAATAFLGGARALWYPEIRLSGAYVDRGRWNGDHMAEWQVGAGLNYPLYTGGSRKSAIARAESDVRATSAESRAARDQVEQGVHDAVAAWVEARSRADALARAADESAELVRIERLTLDAGSGVQATYLDAEAALVATRAALGGARHRAVLARLEIARLTGDLTGEWLARTLEQAP